MGNQAGMIEHAFVFYSLTPGRCGYGPNVAELCGALRAAHSPLAERRQMAFRHARGGHAALAGATKAIERATQVRLTPEIIAASFTSGGEERARAVLEAAGFEVIE